MVPTLVGTFTQANCNACGLQWPMEPQLPHPSPAGMNCFHCGKSIRLGVTSRGDVVSLRRVTENDLRRGDLVAIRWDDQLRVKRIAALPGDRLELDAMHLKVNGERFEDLMALDHGSNHLARFLVDRDSRRAGSRWSPTDSDSPWTRTPQRAWSFSQPGDSDWLVYGHEDVRHGNRSSQVWDDYPFNISLARKLYSVDRFRLSGKIRCESVVMLDIAFWSRRGAKLATVMANGDRDFAVSCYDAIAARSMPVGESNPVAIRVRGGGATISQLGIDRFIEYRVRPHDDRGRYPLKIASGQCFVLGDNVPVSIDSRDIGPVPLANVERVVMQ